MQLRVAVIEILHIFGEERALTAETRRVDVRDVVGVDPVSLIRFEKVLVTVPALKKVEEMLA